MNNQEAICYAILMIRRIKRQNKYKTDEKDTFHILNNIHSIMDVRSKSESVDRVERVLRE